MAELYIFSPNDELLTIITEETGLISAPFREELNRVPDTPFSFTVEADAENAQYVVEENQVVFRDKEGELRLYVIKELDDVDNIDGPQTTAICESAFMELKEHIIEDRRFVDKEAQEALDGALEGTRWIGEVEVELGTATENFYYISSLDAVWKILSTWGGEFKDVVEFDEKNNIVARKIKILQRRGADRGKRFEIDHNIEEIQRTVLSYPVTALYGRGASVPTTDEEGNETGGYTRYIDFADVEWSKAKGDPVDKPKGQKWVGDPQALQKYGRLHNGEKLHRFDIVENQDIADPAELLRWTWDQLQEKKKPEVNYALSVHLLEMLAGYEHEHVELGDTAIVIDRLFARPIEIQARVIAIQYDLVDIEGTAAVEMGQFLSVYQYDDRVDKIEEIINNNRGTWEAGAGPITNDRFPDIKPESPTNVEAVGGFKTIQLYWDYDSNVYISHYEVYGSQVQGFVPDSQHLLWRGKVSSFAHEVNTDEVWYYRIRAVNTHGTAGDFSNEVSAATVRIISDDILFGAINAQHIADLAITAEKLANGTIDLSKIGEDVKSEIDGAKEQAQTAVYTANQATQDAQEAISQAQQGFDAAQSALVAATSAQTTANDASTKAQQSFDAAQSALTTAQNALDASNVLSQRVDQNSGDISTLYQTTDSLGSRIIDAEGDISAIQQMADSLSTRIENAEGNISSLTQTALGLQTSVSDLLGDVSTLTQTANSLNSTITNVQNDLTNLQIGGRNLLVNSSQEFRNITLNQWGGYNRYELIWWKHLEELGLKNGDYITLSMYFDDVSEENSVAMRFDFNKEDNSYISSTGQQITKPGRYSFTAKIPDNEEFVKLSIRLMPKDSQSNYGYQIKYKEAKLEKGNRATDWTPAPEDYDAQFSSINQTINSITTTVQDAQGDISALQQTANSLATRITGAEGNISTLTQTVDGLQTQVSAIEGDVSSLTQTANSLQSRISTAEGNISTLTQTANSLTSQISAKADQSWVSSQISQLSNAINLRVEKDKIINQINISTEGILIDGKKVHINGETTIDNGIIKSAMIADAAITQAKIANAAVGNAAIQNGAITNAKIATAAVGTAQIQDASITDAKIANISADKINAGAIRGIDIYGSKLRSSDGLTNLEIIGGNIRLTQSNGQYVNVNSAGLFGYNSSNVMTFRVDKTLVTSSALGTSVENVYLGAYGEARVVNYDDIPGDGLVGSYRYLPLRADGFYGNFLDITTGVNLYIRPYSNGEVRITNTGSTTSYRPLRASNLYADSVDVNSGTSIYLRPASNGSAHITATGTTNNYRPIYASEYRTGSSIEYKTNITELQRPAVEIIRGLHVVEYDLKSDIENGEYNNRQIGLISEENPEVASPDGKAINIYKLTSINTAGIQEHDVKIKDLEDTVEWFRIENQYLKQKVSQLESRIQELEGKVA